MKLSELIKQAGDENVVFQNILHSSPEIRVGKKEGTISFCSEKAKTSDLCRQASTGESGQWTALVVWIPTEKIPASV